MAKAAKAQALNRTSNLQGNHGAFGNQYFTPPGLPRWFNGLCTTVDLSLDSCVVASLQERADCSLMKTPSHHHNQGHGFHDKAQGTLFFHLANIIEAKRPSALLLENVKNLRSHNKGDTWKTISDRLNELGYQVFDKTIDAASYVPQHRERIFIVGFRRDVFGDNIPFRFPEPPQGKRPKLSDVLEKESKVPEKYILTEHLWNYLQQYAIKHQQKGNGFGCSVADRKGITRTLSARYYKDGSEILIPRGEGKIPRRLMPLEAGRLMGFPEELVRKQVVSDTQAYRQFGNAVVPKVAEAVAHQIAEILACCKRRR